MWLAIGVLILSAVLSNAARPKQQQPKPQQVDTPVAEEGRRISKIYGTVWVDDLQVLGFKKIGTDRIVTKGGKK